MKHSILSVIALLLVLPLLAQQSENEVQTLLLSRQKADIAYGDTTLKVVVRANNEYTIAPSSGWLTVTQESAQQVRVDVQASSEFEPRIGNVTFTTADGLLKRVLEVTQAANTSVTELKTQELVPCSSATASEAQPGSPASNLIDGDFTTPYHSPWNVSANFPVTLTFNFASAPHIDYFVYTPRSDGNVNGNIGAFDLEVKYKGSSTFVAQGSYDFHESGAPSMVDFGEGLDNVSAIRLKVNSGGNNYVSGMEVQFFRNVSDNPDFAVFDDAIWTTLKAGTTQADVDALQNSFCKILAQQLLDGTYDKEYRVSEFPALYHPNVLSDMWRAPGKYYDQLDGVTGINVASGSVLGVLASGIPSGVNVQLKVMAWYTGKDGSNFDGSDPHCTSYSLRNGLNVINYDYEYDGLAYLTYFAYDDPSKYAPVKLHIVNGVQNGFLSPDKTNNQMYLLCRDAKNVCMDLVGSKVHSIWTAAGLRDYCKTSTNAARGYRQYLNLLDTLVQWEHELLGFVKYDRVPKNHTMAYTNWTYYMFQGSWGVSFHHGQEARVLNCQTLMKNDYDAVWGLSHEWGHQHQMAPYFNWAGMTEVTNNMNSYYNTVHMGYSTGYGHGAEPADGEVIYNGVVKGILAANDQTTYTTLTQDGGPQTTRKNAYNNRSNYQWNSKLYALCESMSDDSWTDKEKDGPLWFDYTNYNTVRPFVALYQYATSVLGLTDFGPDLYEALRQTDEANGSQIEKQGGVDKYELIASAQNYNVNSKLTQLRSQYPTSVWVTSNYITADHCDRWGNSVPFIMNYIRKTSRLTGYNLFPYFEKCGMLRQVALRIYDGNNYLMTKEMYDEFKADMAALGLKECSDAMVKDILTTKTPVFARPTIPN